MWQVGSCRCELLNFIHTLDMSYSVWPLIRPAYSYGSGKLYHERLCCLFLMGSASGKMHHSDTTVAVGFVLLKKRWLPSFVISTFCTCVLQGVPVQMALKVKTVRWTLMTVKIMTVRIIPLVWMESTTTPASVHQNTQVSLTNLKLSNEGLIVLY